ncbi:MAG: pyridoxamine 5'-phosphate oxidase family protein [Actinomycetes bacterium]|jgi:uncharacterized protein|nr:MAG: pyridoxamine 5'-phosphate oxidase [Actinomycetota bacterium]
MRTDSVGLRVLSRAECVGLLATAPIGRVVFTDRALPAVQPVNFTLDGETVVFRTGAGTRLAAAARDTVVAFEADAFDPAGRTGWSVTVIGHARAVTEPAEIERLSRLPLECWVPGGRDRFIVLPIEHITGRRIGIPEARPETAISTGSTHGPAHRRRRDRPPYRSPAAGARHHPRGAG